MFESKLIGMRNFSRAFIDGCTNLKASAFKEHASSLMHQKSMVLYKKSQSVPVTEYAPIAIALSTIDEQTEAVMARKCTPFVRKDLLSQKCLFCVSYRRSMVWIWGQGIKTTLPVLNLYTTSVWL